MKDGLIETGGNPPIRDLEREAKAIVAGAGQGKSRMLDKLQTAATADATSAESTETLLDAVARQIAERSNRTRSIYRALGAVADRIFGEGPSTDKAEPSDAADPVNSLEKISQSLSDLTRDIDRLQSQVERFNSL